MILTMAARITTALLLCSIFNSVTSFNVDVKDPYLFNQPLASYFGYSVALMKPNWLIVGAPKADRNPGEVEYGVVYKCDVNSNSNTCTRMNNFDTLPTSQINDNGTMRDSDIKKGQMFGATVRTFGDSVVACAPNYINTGDLGQNAWMTGKCEIRNEQFADEDKVWNPCVQEISKSAQFGYCQVGLDAALTPLQTHMVSDAIGINYWMGRLVYTTTDSIGDVYAPAKELKGSAYMGYAVASGIFTKDKKFGIVGGAPRGNAMEGMVVIYYPSSAEFLVLTAISNPSGQSGAYFGASVAAPDLNGDGFSDLAVGAPFFTVKSNEGAVYIYINNKQNALNLVSTPLYGDGDKGAQFGFCVVNAGDLNSDSFDDIAVGAPYGGKDGKGVVYLYYGARDGINSKYSQRIAASSIGSNLLTFGHSLVGGVDMDNNGYPDIAIGSYSSESVVFLRSRPVYNVFGEMTLNVSKISLTNAKSICTAPDGKQYKCVGAELCFSIFGKSLNVAPIAGEQISYTFEIDKERVADKRGFLMKDDRRLTSISGNISVTGKACINENIYLFNNTRDVFFPLVFDLSYTYVEPSPCNLCGISNKFLPSSVQDRVAYVKGCGNDDICQADLKLTTQLTIPGGYNEIKLGIVDTISVEVKISNTGENAYLATLNMIHDDSLSIMAVISKTDFNPLWEVERVVGAEKSNLYFSIGNPLSENKEQVLEIRMDVARLPYNTKSISLDFEAKTESVDVNKVNNKFDLVIPVETIADLTISGNAFPEQIKYFSNVTSVEQRGTTLIHTVLVQNLGPSAVESSKVQIKLPDTADNDYLLNLLSIQVEGAGLCLYDPSILDPLKLANKTANNTSVTSSSLRSRRSEDTTCDTASCKSFTCDIGKLKRGESVTIKLKSTVVEFNFIKRGITNTKLILSASITTDGTIIQPVKQKPDSAQIPVVIQEYGIGDGGKTSKSVPWWVIFLSVLAGAILIAACVYLLYKKGFFERTKHEQVPQHETDPDLEDF